MCGIGLRSRTRPSFAWTDHRDPLVDVLGIGGTLPSSLSLKSGTRDGRRWVVLGWDVGTFKESLSDPQVWSVSPDPLRF